MKLYNTRCRKGTACPPVDPPLLKHKTALYFLTGMFFKIIQFTRCDRLHKTLTIFYHVAMVFLATNLNNQSNSGFLTLRWVLLQPSLIPLLQIGRWVPLFTGMDLIISRDAQCWFPNRINSVTGNVLLWLIAMTTGTHQFKHNINLE